MAAPIKTLSNGTMALRFMQNAQRMKNEAQVELKQAKVRDDAEWEVSREIREAWGLGSSSRSEQAVIHEQSYLPFLFAQDESDAPQSTHMTAVKICGRRSFKQNGEEVPVGGDVEANTETSERRFAGESKEDVKSASTSDRSAVVTTARSDSKPKKRDEHKKRAPVPVLQMISDAKDVGVDLKVAHKRQGSENLATGFLRPAGVDSPSTGAKHEEMDNHNPFEMQKGKRSIDSENKDGGERRKKKRKKTQLSTD